MFEQAMSHYLSLNLKKSLNQPIDQANLGFFLYVSQVCGHLVSQVNMTEENKLRIVSMYNSLNVK
jgi:hypothetical protein